MQWLKTKTSHEWSLSSRWQNEPIQGTTEVMRWEKHVNKHQELIGDVRD